MRDTHNVALLLPSLFFWLYELMNLASEQAQHESGLVVPFSNFLLKVSESLDRYIPNVLASRLIFGSDFVLVGSNPGQLSKK